MDLEGRAARALAGNLHRDAAKLAKANKLFARDRLAALLDPGSFVEDGLLANALAEDLPADGVVTGVGRVDGRPVCVMANDATVKAGSWGARTVEKIVRLTEHALRHELPVFWLVDSAGARITVTHGEGAVDVEVVDDGGGASGPAPTDAASGGTGHGLAGMRERAESVGGSLVPTIRWIRDRYFELAKTSLGAGSFEIVRGEGRAMPLSLAIVFAQQQALLPRGPA